MRLVTTAVAPETHRHIFCLDLMFHHSNRSVRAAKEKIEDVQGNLESKRGKVSEVLEAVAQPFYVFKALSSLILTLVERVSCPRLF